MSRCVHVFVRLLSVSSPCPGTARHPIRAHHILVDTSQLYKLHDATTCFVGQLRYCTRSIACDLMLLKDGWCGRLYNIGLGVSEERTDCLRDKVASPWAMAPTLPSPFDGRAY